MVNITQKLQPAYNFIECTSSVLLHENKLEICVSVLPQLKMESASARIVKKTRRQDNGREEEKVYGRGEG